MIAYVLGQQRNMNWKLKLELRLQTWVLLLIDFNVANSEQKF